MDNEERLSRAVKPLIAWFDGNRRELPWRRDASPYHVWISEIMLQQTRIEAVLPYYTRFIRELPDVEALAACDDERLMKLWQGLGYYSRARNLKRAAEIVVSAYHGVLPKDAEELKKLPGIGDYTAGAIASIACGKPAPAVDGNVLRVLSRLLAFDDDVLKPETKKGVTRLLEKVYPEGEEAAKLTQGLMELGEVICLPNAAPICDACPWQTLCAAHTDGRERDFPVRSPKKARRVEYLCVVVAENNGRFALRKRPPSGLLAGLWELPNFPVKKDENDLESVVKQNGFTYESAFPCADAGHIFTHVEWHMRGIRLENAAGSADLDWCTPEEILEERAVPTAFRAYIKEITKKGKRGAL